MDEGGEWVRDIGRIPDGTYQAVCSTSALARRVAAQVEIGMPEHG
jgi:hypothetical protein